MRTIEQALQAAQKLDLPFLIESTLMDQSRQYVKLQRDQLRHGLNSEGKRIGTYLNEQYADMKHELNPLAGYGNVDLILEGGFSGDLFLDVRQTSFLVESGDEKSQSLQEKYDENGKVLGLEDERKEEFVEYVRPIFVEAVAKDLSK